MKEMVEYDNTLNSLQFKGFTAMDYNILMCLCNKVKNKGQAKLTFSFSELKKLTAFDNQSDTAFASNLDRMIEKLIHVNATHINGGKKAYFVLFPTFIVDTDKRTLTVSVNKDFTFILNQLSNEFTQFELKEFAELDSKYAKTLYKNLKQFKRSGWWRPSVEELRVVLDVPSNYSNKRIMGDILKPALAILSDKFDDLKCEPIRAKKRGAPIERYYFTFTAEGQTSGQTNMNDAEEEMTKFKASKSKKKTAKKNSFNNFAESPSTPKTKNEWEDLEAKLLDN